MSRVTSSSSGGNVNIQDTNGNPITATNGAINVNVTSGTSGNKVLVYNELTLVPIGIETTIATYIVAAETATFTSATLSSENIGIATVYINSQPVDKQYITYTAYNLQFSFKDIVISSGDILEVKATNMGQTACSINAKIQIIEV